MIYAEDLRLGQVIPCASYCISREEMIDFARRYDPQPFHLTDEDAIHSLFGRLTASGIHSGCATRKLTLQHVASQVRYLGSPGGLHMQMKKPVYPDMEVKVRATIRSVVPLQDQPEVALVDCHAEGFDSAGELVITMQDFLWVGTRKLAHDFDATSLLTVAAAAPPLGEVFLQLPFEPAVTPKQERLFWEDCPVGQAFRSEPFVVSNDEVATFRRQFDAAPGADGRQYRNDWHMPAAAMRVMAKNFWLKLEHVGGTGTELLRIPRSIEAGDRLHGETIIVNARPLRSRPGIGAIQKRTICANQRNEVVASFVTTTFLRMRERS